MSTKLEDIVIRQKLSFKERELFLLNGLRRFSEKILEVMSQIQF